MEKYLVVVPGYPSNGKKYNNAFVHTRVKQYLKAGLNIDVFSVDKYAKKGKYVFDGVEVNSGGYEELTKILSENSYEKVLIHFGFKKIVKTVIKASPKSKLVIWVHGTEALGWYRRLFAFNMKKPYRFFGYIFLNTRQLLFLNCFIRDEKVDKTFIFVSEWMKNIMEKDTLSKGKIKKYKIIPNAVDLQVFKYNKKQKEDRLKILSIRSYSSKKYANDVSVKAIMELSKRPFFDELYFTLYGEGRLFDKTLKPIRKFSNVKIYNKFLTQKEIASEHKKNGLMLIPTRQDAQGVSMCEAMCSGLVPLTSNNTAIPEFVNDSVGFLTNNYIDLANAIEEIYYNPNKFLKMSARTSKHIKKLCSSEKILKKELEIIKE